MQSLGSPEASAARKTSAVACERIARCLATLFAPAFVALIVTIATATMASAQAVSAGTPQGAQRSGEEFHRDERHPGQVQL